MSLESKTDACNNPIEVLSFDNFIIDRGNESAYEIAKDISIYPGTRFNPFFIYGKSGLGKTHLLKAIETSIHNSKPDMKVLYMTTRDFTGEFIKSISENSTDEFNSKLREQDIFLIDELDEIKDKPETQSKLLYIINSFLDHNKQIVLSSCISPRRITLSNRILFRNKYSTVIQIAAPDLESKIKFLQSYAEQNGITVTRDLLNYIAGIIPSNYAIMGSILKSLQAVSGFSGIPISAQSIKAMMKQCGF